MKTEIQNLREGVKRWSGRSGVHGSKGQVILTKNVSKGEAIPFILELIQLLQFPGYFMVDMLGFIKNSEDDAVFTFASPNSALKLQNDKNFILFDSPETTKATYNYFSSMNDKSLLSNWFDQHNIISDYTASGFVPKRLISVVCFFEPTTLSVKQIFETK